MKEERSYSDQQYSGKVFGITSSWGLLFIFYIFYSGLLDWNLNLNTLFGVPVCSTGIGVWGGGGGRVAAALPNSGKARRKNRPEKAKRLTN